MAAKFGVNPATAIMIGDRLDTDVAFGNMAGVSSALVLTGVTTPEDLLGKVCMYIVYVCMYVCMHACMYLCMYVHECPQR